MERDAGDMQANIEVWQSGSRDTGTIGSCAALLVPRGEKCEVPLGSSRVIWTQLDRWDRTLPHAHRFCGAAMWMTNAASRACGFGLLRGARSFMAPRQPLVAILAQPPTPRECFRLMEVCADFVDVSSERDWVSVLEHLVTGYLRGVALLHAFCETHQLSPRESFTVFTACAGLSKVEAYEVLGCSQRTLETYWSRIFLKVGIRSTAGVVAAALRSVLPRYAR